MVDKSPSRHPDKPGMRGGRGQGDVAPGAQRDRLRKDQHFAGRPASAGELPDPYGEGGFAAGGDGPGKTRQSGYGVDYGQLEGAQRPEKQVTEQQIRKAGTDAKSNR